MYIQVSDLLRHDHLVISNPLLLPNSFNYIQISIQAMKNTKKKLVKQRAPE